MQKEIPFTGYTTSPSDYNASDGQLAAAKALSQGRFGQLPLYAFTTEGGWALEVSSSGTYSARQPVTRDVCTNPASITQLDSVALFATDRGIMMLVRSYSCRHTSAAPAIWDAYPLDI